MSASRPITINDVGDKIPDLDTLPQRMRYAAEILTEVIQRDVSYGAFGARSYTPAGLREAADRWENTDTEAEELAQVLCPTIYPDAAPFNEQSISTQRLWLKRARQLIDSGWRKDDS